MKQNKFGEMVFAEPDLMDLVMQGHEINSLQHVVVDETVNLEQLILHVESPESLMTWTFPYNQDTSVPEFHLTQQMTWLMPDKYKTLDIAEYVLSLCQGEAELQRCGAELLMYQERDLFNLLRYLKYLVDVMTENRIIWGVGRGSSVASFVLYKLGVHRIDSLHYNLDVAEFLR
jgi:Bacterial DNA polymerase III alpha NTPase domain